MVRYTGSAVQRRFSLGVLSGGPEPGVGVGAGVEQGSGRCNEAAGPSSVETQVLRQAEIVERVTAVGWCFRGNVRRIAIDEPPDGVGVAEDRGSVDRAATQLRVRRPEGLG